MSGQFTVDLISDLKLTSADEFNWQDKASSLFCVVAGGISSDVSVISRVLEHLGKIYRGVLYIDGSVDHENLFDYDIRVEEITEICKRISNVVYLHNHVVVLNNVAFLAANCWYKNGAELLTQNDVTLCDEYRVHDIGYLSRTLKSLQLHHDVHRIVMITASPPNETLLYQGTESSKEMIEPAMSLFMDTETKVKTWLYGGTSIVSDEQIFNRHYVNNPRIHGQPYWPKCVIV